jgi:hypothetical protein
MNLDPRFFRTAIALFALLLATGQAVKDLRDYRQAGSHPASMSMSDATAASSAMPFIRRWINLREPLQLECSQALFDGGDVEENAATIILALDEPKQHAFLLQYRGKVSCDAASTLPLEGMLVQPSAKFWTTHGMSLPNPSLPLMQIDVGSDPTGLLKEAEVLGGVVVICAALLWYTLIFSRRRPSRPIPVEETTFAKAARVP